MSISDDPDIQRLKIPKQATSELEQLANAPPPKPVEHSAFSAPKFRFYAALLSVLTFGLLNLIGNSIACLRFTALLVGLLAIEWTALYSNALSRRRQAFFDVRNVLDTYQTRARTHGHLFQPEPDTPKPQNCCPAPDKNIDKNPMKTVGQEIINEMSNTHFSQFDKNVHDHYAGMYDNIKRELSLLEQAKKANQARADAGNPDGHLVPAEIPIFGNLPKSDTKADDSSKQ